MPKDRETRTSIRQTVKVKSARQAILKHKANTISRKAMPKFDLGRLRTADGMNVNVGIPSSQPALKTAGISVKQSRRQVSAGLPENHRPNERQDAAKALAAVVARATDVIGNKEKALRWMGSPIRALDFATPISLLGTKKGAVRVNRVLGQMEHGIW